MSMIGSSTMVILLLLSVLACGQPQINTADENDDGRLQLIENLNEQRRLIRAAMESGSEAYDLVKEYASRVEEYARSIPGDTACPAYLLEAADLVGGVGLHGRSIELWGLLWRQHSNHPEAPYALFMQAFVFETIIGDKLNAKRYYQKVTEQYPGHPLAQSANQAINVLNQRGEDLIRTFEER